MRRRAPSLVRQRALAYLFGLFTAVSLQKSVRDRAEGVPVTAVYFGRCWIALGIALALLTVGLWNAHSITRSAKGFYGMAFALSLFAAVAVQKNVRDVGRSDYRLGVPLTE